MAIQNIGTIPVGAFVAIIGVTILSALSLTMWIIVWHRSAKRRRQVMTGTHQSVLYKQPTSVFTVPHSQLEGGHVLLITSAVSAPSLSTTTDGGYASQHFHAPPPHPLPPNMHPPAHVKDSFPEDEPQPIISAFPKTPMTAVTVGPLPPYVPSTTGHESIPPMPRPPKGESTTYRTDPIPRPLSRVPSYSTHACASGWQGEEPPPLPRQAPSAFPRKK